MIIAKGSVPWVDVNMSECGVSIIMKHIESIKEIVAVIVLVTLKAMDIFFFS